MAVLRNPSNWRRFTEEELENLDFVLNGGDDCYTLSDRELEFIEQMDEEREKSHSLGQIEFLAAIVQRSTSD